MAHQEDWTDQVEMPGSLSGAVAQLGEHLLCMQRVRSSNLLGSTSFQPRSSKRIRNQDVAPGQQGTIRYAAESE
jgi:hypothetical protein